MESKIGICVLDGTLKSVKTAIDAGVDYCELPSWSMLVEPSDDEFRRLVSELNEMGANIETCNLFIPPHMRLTGPERNLPRIREYIDKSLERTKQLGISLMGFGSGPARAIESGQDPSAALDELEEVFRYAADRGHEHGITIALEPLRKVETNVFNTLAEGAEFIRTRGIDNLKIMADNLHMMTHHEPFGTLRSVADILAHVHLSDNARIPVGYGRWDLAPMLSELAAIQYTGRYSIEVFWNDIGEQSRHSVSTVRRLLAEIQEGQRNEQ